jgi:lipopolysaccharide heptosyltransferase II
MANNWQQCKNILCIRPDNMGDLLMTGPALRALKESFGAKITVLTSSMAAGIAAYMHEIDDVMVCDLPWVKTNEASDPEVFNTVVARLKERHFDAAVIFTVYSQNPLPTVMLAYLAGIPLRLAYCRENPYQLLTDWVPDEEPYGLIKHQVNRDMNLVASIGATTQNDKLNLQLDDAVKGRVYHKLRHYGVNPDKPWLVMHPGVSEPKREYPEASWIEVGENIVATLGYQLLITGSSTERGLTERIQDGIGDGSFAMGGVFGLDEFMALVACAPVVISVNTGTVHIAAALSTPVVVLYALTNPQHTPWKVLYRILPFSVPVTAQSKNEVIRFVSNRLYTEFVDIPDETDVLNAVQELLHSRKETGHITAEVFDLPGQVQIENRVAPAS